MLHRKPLLLYRVGPVSFLTQRVQVPNIDGLWLQTPYLKWFLGSETTNIGYLDPLGYRDNVSAFDPEADLTEPLASRAGTGEAWQHGGGQVVGGEPMGRDTLWLEHSTWMHRALGKNNWGSVGLSRSGVMLDIQ